MSQGFNDNGYNAAIAQSRPNGVAWGNMVSNILRMSQTSAQRDFVEGDKDAIDTLKRFSRIWDSIYKMFRNPMYINTHENAKKEFIFILADSLNFIIRETQSRTGAVAYAGSLHGHERNIHQRFIHKDGNWLRYMTILIDLLRVEGVAILFREARVQASLQETWRIVCYFASHAAPMAGPLGDFQDRFQQFLEALRSESLERDGGFGWIANTLYSSMPSTHDRRLTSRMHAVVGTFASLHTRAIFHRFYIGNTPDGGILNECAA